MCAVKYKKDDVIVSEATPFMQALKTRFTGRGCDWCYVRTTWDGVQLLYCSKCRHATYCSKECQQSDWLLGGHKYECRLFRKPGVYELIDDGQLSEQSWSRICVRMALKLGFDTTLLTTTFQGFDGREWTWQSLPVAMCTELEITRSMDGITLQLLMDHFPGKGDIWRSVTRDLCAKMRLYTLTVPNPNGMWDLAMRFYWQSIGIVKSASPNAVATFNENRLNVVAKRAIRQGEQVSIGSPPTLSSLIQSSQSPGKKFVMTGDMMT